MRLSLRLPKLSLAEQYWGDFIEQLLSYFSKAVNVVNILFGTTITVVNFILFPDKAYAYAAFALGVAVLVDIFSKYVAITRKNGGFKRAFQGGKLFSKTLWVGTKVKLQAYLSISIMVGVSYRLNFMAGAFTSVSVFMATVVYTVLFLREFQSILENFRDAGAENVEWLLFWVKDKENEIFKQSKIDTPKNKTDRDDSVDDLDKYI